MHLRAWAYSALLSLFIVFSFVVLTSRRPVSLARPVASCPAIQDVSLRPLGDENFNGTSEKTSGKYHDHFIFDREHKFKVGVREEWNGAVVFFGAEHNLIDDSEASRALQLAFHDDSRAVEGCAAHSSCLLKNSHHQACGDEVQFPGWTAIQASNACGKGLTPNALNADKAGLDLSFSPMQLNPAWNSQSCEPQEKACARNLTVEKSSLRVHQSLRFIRPGVLEIEYLVTNPEHLEIIAKNGLKHEFPRLFAARELNSLKNTRNPDHSEKRQPAAAASEQELLAENGWFNFQNASGDQALGLYWENRNQSFTSHIIENQSNGIRSNFPFAIPAANSLRTRVYLLLGNSNEIKTSAEKLDHEMPPFGRIEENEISEDTRSVSLKGWALDNKSLKKLELFVDGKKVDDLKLNASREDICGEYPGYSMCAKGMHVGFEATYQRPEGKGCEKTVEVKATDDDGNSRIIARTGITPVSYSP